MHMKHFTRQEMHDELVVLVHAQLVHLERQLEPGCAQRLLGLPVEAPLPAPAGLSLSRFAIVDTLSALYDYAIHARWDTCGGVMVLSDCISDAADFTGQAMALCRQRRMALYGCCEALVRCAQARLKLDIPGDAGDFSIAELASLAHMSEKSIRNAACALPPHRLETYHHLGRTLVRRSDALAWLAGRRSFQPTTFIDSIDAIDPTRFQTLQDSGAWLRQRRQMIGMGVETLVQRLGLPPAQVRLVEQVEAGQQPMPDGAMPDWLALLGIDPFWWSVRTLPFAATA